MDDPEKFAIQLSIICKYSPFKSEAELMNQFNAIYGESGECFFTPKLYQVQSKYDVFPWCVWGGLTQLNLINEYIGPNDSVSQI